MRRLTISLLLILIAYLGLVTYTNRALLFSKFDEAYWKNKYEQSQWKLPLSVRTIGDDGLYLYEGYRLVHGNDPTSSNAEMPPLGKYLIGISIVLFGNGYLYGFIVTVALIIATYALAKLILKQSALALCVALLLATDPLITNQYALTMMDSLQALLLVTFFYAIFSVPLLKERALLRAGAAGLILGLFSVTKLPVLTPILVFFGGLYLWGTTKKPILLLGVAAGAIVGYMLPYTSYFMHGHTVIDWIKIQKWMVSFYLHSNLTPTWGSAVSVLFTGMYQNIFSREWLPAGEWTPVWGILTFAAITALITRIRTRISYISYDTLLIVCAIIIALYSFIPFWSRYLVVILPLLYIVGVHRLIIRLPDWAKIGIIALLLIVNISASLQILFRTPDATVRQYVYNAEHLLFADLYEDTTAEYRKSTNRNTFEQFGYTTMAQGEIEFIDITPTNTLTDRWTSPQYLTANATFFTRRLGSFTMPVRIPFVKEDGRWRIPWDWSLLLPGLTGSTRLVSSVDEAKRGTIFGPDKKPLARDTQGTMIWITPGITDKLREDQLLPLLERLFDGRLPKVAIHQRFVGNTSPTLPVPLGVAPYPESNPKIQELLSYSGISVTNADAREYTPNDLFKIGAVSNTTYPECCSYLYNATAYNGTSGIEETQNAALKGINGGTLLLINDKGATVREFIHQTKRDGGNIQL